MQPFGNLGDHKVILACEDRFLCTYLSSGLQQLGMNVIGSARSIEEILRLAEGEQVPPIACISVNLPGVTPAAIGQLTDKRIPHILCGVPWTANAWTAALMWPFSAYQVAQDLHTAWRESVLASAVPPWGDTPPSD